jgi:membrane fusion protein (multidrug efflux system)
MRNIRTERYRFDKVEKPRPRGLAITETQELRIMLNADLEDRGAQMLHEVEGSQSVEAFSGRPSGNRACGGPVSEASESWARAKEGSPSARRPQSPPEPETKPEPEVKEEQADPQVVKASPKGFLRRRPVISAIGALALTATVGCGYVYFDYTQHFESTDDAFIASRQFGIAPKVSGYITQLLVTDNQHVEAGDVIARIDDHDFRVALEQADAQVAAAEASIRSTDAQIVVQQAQIEAAAAQVEQAKAGLVFAQQQAARSFQMRSGSRRISRRPSSTRCGQARR